MQTLKVWKTNLVILVTLVLYGMGQVAILDISMGFWVKTGIAFLFMLINVAICNKFMEWRKDIRKENLRSYVKEVIKEDIAILEGDN